MGELYEKRELVDLSMKTDGWTMTKKMRRS
jgi:hypothetical protein